MEEIYLFKSNGSMFRLALKYLLYRNRKFDPFKNVKNWDLLVSTAIRIRNEVLKDNGKDGNDLKKLHSAIDTGI